LGKLFYGLVRERVAEICVFDAERWAQPGEGEAVVERIAVLWTGAGKS